MGDIYSTQSIDEQYNGGGLPKETEVLTYDRGWIPVSELKGFDKILVRDPGVEEASFEKPTAVGQYVYNGPLLQYQYQGDDFTLPATQTLLISYSYDRRKNFGAKSDQVLSLAELKHRHNSSLTIIRKVRWEKEVSYEDVTLFAYSVSFMHQGKWRKYKHYHERKIPKRAFNRFLAYFLADGSTAHGRHHSRVVHIARQDTPENKEKRERIRQTIEEMGFTATPTPDGFVINNTQLGILLWSQRRAWLKRFPYNPFEWFDQELAKEFLEVYMETDGMARVHKSTGLVSGRLYTTSPHVKDTLQIVTLLAGYGCYLGARVYDPDNPPDTLMKRTCWNLYASPRHNLYSALNYKHLETITDTVHLYQLEVPAGCFLIRSGKKCLWVGDAKSCRQHLFKQH